MASKKWKPTKAYNIRGMRAQFTVHMPDGRDLCVGPHTWIVPLTKEEEKFWELELTKSNPPHWVVTTCEVEWIKERKIWEPVRPEPDMSDYDREIVRREEEAVEEEGGTAGGGPE